MVMIFKNKDTLSGTMENTTINPVSGEEIKRQRENKGISLDEIKEKTKIGKFTLKLIEENAYSSLPAPVYLKSFLRQIAAIIGLDPDRTASGYIQNMLENSQKREKISRNQ